MDHQDKLTKLFNIRRTLDTNENYSVTTESIQTVDESGSRETIRSIIIPSSSTKKKIKSRKKSIAESQAEKEEEALKIYENEIRNIPDNGIIDSIKDISGKIFPDENYTPPKRESRLQQSWSNDADLQLKINTLLKIAKQEYDENIKTLEAQQVEKNTKAHRKMQLDAEYKSLVDHIITMPEYIKDQMSTVPLHKRHIFQEYVEVEFMENLPLKNIPNFYNPELILSPRRLRATTPSPQRALDKRDVTGPTNKLASKKKQSTRIETNTSLPPLQRSVIPRQARPSLLRKKSTAKFILKEQILKEFQSLADEIKSATDTNINLKQTALYNLKENINSMLYERGLSPVHSNILNQITELPQFHQGKSALQKRKEYEDQRFEQQPEKFIPDITPTKWFEMTKPKPVEIKKSALEIRMEYTKKIPTETLQTAEEKQKYLELVKSLRPEPQLQPTKSALEIRRAYAKSIHDKIVPPPTLLEKRSIPGPSRIVNRPPSEIPMPEKKSALELRKEYAKKIPRQPSKSRIEVERIAKPLSARQPIPFETEKKKSALELRREYVKNLAAQLVLKKPSQTQKLEQPGTSKSAREIRKTYTKSIPDKLRPTSAVPTKKKSALEIRREYASQLKPKKLGPTAIIPRQIAKPVDRVYKDTDTLHDRAYQYYLDEKEKLEQLVADGAIDTFTFGEEHAYLEQEYEAQLGIIHKYDQERKNIFDAYEAERQNIEQIPNIQERYIKLEELYNKFKIILDRFDKDVHASPQKVVTTPQKFIETAKAPTARRLIPSKSKLPPPPVQTKKSALELRKEYANKQTLPKTQKPAIQIKKKIPLPASTVPPAEKKKSALELRKEYANKQPSKPAIQVKKKIPPGASKTLPVEKKKSALEIRKEYIAKLKGHTDVQSVIPKPWQSVIQRTKQILEQKAVEYFRNKVETIRHWAIEGEIDLNTFIEQVNLVNTDYETLIDNLKSFSENIEKVFKKFEEERKAILQQIPNKEEQTKRLDELYATHSSITDALEQEFNSLIPDELYIAYNEQLKKYEEEARDVLLEHFARPEVQRQILQPQSRVNKTVPGKGVQRKKQISKSLRALSPEQKKSALELRQEYTKKMAAKPVTKTFKPTQFHAHVRPPPVIVDKRKSALETRRKYVESLPPLPEKKSYAPTKFHELVKPKLDRPEPKKSALELRREYAKSIPKERPRASNIRPGSRPKTVVSRARRYPKLSTLEKRALLSFNDEKGKLEQLLITGQIGDETYIDQLSYLETELQGKTDLLLDFPTARKNILDKYEVEKRNIQNQVEDQEERERLLDELYQKYMNELGDYEQNIYLRSEERVPIPRTPETAKIPQIKLPKDIIEKNNKNFAEIQKLHKQSKNKVELINMVRQRRPSDLYKSAKPIQELIVTNKSVARKKLMESARERAKKLRKSIPNEKRDTEKIILGISPLDKETADDVFKLMMNEQKGISLTKPPQDVTNLLVKSTGKKLNIISDSLGESINEIVPVKIPTTELNELNALTAEEIANTLTILKNKIPEDNLASKAISVQAKVPISDKPEFQADELEVCKVLLNSCKYENYFQFRGSTIPKWFPGFFSAGPETNSTGAYIQNSPSSLFLKAWDALKPTWDMPKPSYFETVH